MLFPIKDEIEYIVCSAILVQDDTKMVQPPTNIEHGYVAYGLRHANCYEVLVDRYTCPTRSFRRDGKYAESYHQIEKIQGFLTPKNRFVGRGEARKIALKVGQVQETRFADTLFSEELY